MAGERLPARFSLRSQLWSRWTGKCFETATSHMQTVVYHIHMRKYIALIIILIIFLVLYKYDRPLSMDDVVGTYINTDFNNKHCCVEAPHVNDTLILRSDSTFHSGFWGEGRYLIKTGSPTELELEYDYEYGKAGYSTYFGSAIMEQQHIIINYDLSHRFVKIK